MTAECATKELNARKLHWYVLGVIGGYTRNVHSIQRVERPKKTKKLSYVNTVCS